MPPGETPGDHEVHRHVQAALELYGDLLSRAMDCNDVPPRTTVTTMGNVATPTVAATAGRWATLMVLWPSATSTGPEGLNRTAHGGA